MVTEDGKLLTKNFLESVLPLAIFFHIHQMHSVVSISDVTSIGQGESYMGASESRPHSACNVETWIRNNATCNQPTAQIGKRGKGKREKARGARTTSWVGNPSQRDEWGKQLHHQQMGCFNEWWTRKSNSISSSFKTSDNLDGEVRRNPVSLGSASSTSFLTCGKPLSLEFQSCA